MAFKFRLQTSLRLAQQKMDIVTSVLAQEVRCLQNIIEQRETQAHVVANALAGQTTAGLKEPQSLRLWQMYFQEQKERFLYLESEEAKQRMRVEEKRQRLIEHRIETEKYKRLREKQLKFYQLEELRKEQTVIDEMAQLRVGVK